MSRKKSIEIKSIVWQASNEQLQSIMHWYTSRAPFSHEFGPL